jgi:signal transduction histidine kinase
VRAGLTSRLLVANGLLALIVAGAFGFLIFAMSSVNRSMDSVIHSAQESFTTRDTRRALIDMETSQRGYIITGDPTFLAPWEAGRERVPERLATLRSIVDDPGQAVRAEQLQKDALSYVDDYAVPLVDAARRGEPWVKSISASDEGKRRMDTIRQELENFLSAEQSLSLAEQAAADSHYHRATLVAAGGIVVSVLVIGLGSIYLARTVLRPVRRAARMAERLAAGDLEARLTPQTGTAEIGVLERNFNSMAESLQQNRDDLARLNNEQAALRHIATLVAEGRPANEIFSVVTEEVGLLLHAEITRLLRFEADGTGTVAAAWTQTLDPMPVGARIEIGATVAALVRSSGNPARHIEISPPDLPEGTYCAVGAPIMVGGAPWGAITGLSPNDRALPDDTEIRMAEFTHLVGTAIANAQAHDDLMASRARIVTAADESRRRIERDLHDGIQQRLVTLALKLRTIDAEIPPESSDLRQQLEALDAELVEAIADLREVSRGIHPAILSEGGLAPALRTLARRSEVAVESDIRIESRLSPSVEAAAYYAVAECLTNVAKHASASVVHLGAVVADDQLALSVRDDGTGGADPKGGTGLTGLIDRVEALGGTLTFASPRGSGTAVKIDLPVGMPRQ